MKAAILLGDVLDRLRQMPDESVGIYVVDSLNVNAQTTVPERKIEMADEIKRRRWYMQEAERIISESDEDLLVEILKVRDAACAWYARETCQLSDKFKDGEVVAWLDSKHTSSMTEYGHGFMRDENV